MGDAPGSRRSETEYSESVYESDQEAGESSTKENDLKAKFLYYVDMWKCYWKKRFFKQLVRSSILFIIGMKLLREIKGFDAFGSTLPQIPEGS